MQEVIETVADLFRHQGRSDVVEVLEAAFARLEETDFDNWNGGSSTWALYLEISTALFAPIEKNLEVIEKEIGQKLSRIGRQYPNDHLGAVTITPVPPGKHAMGERMKPSEIEVLHLWEEGKLRLFLSHLAKDKVEVARVKEELSSLGVGSFVAHTDIKPSKAWQDQIELALRSMDALGALITPAFHASVWTDQEVGWALGRGVPVINARLGKDPYGLAGKYQGVPGTLDAPGKLAKDIVGALLNDSQTHGKMKGSLIQALADSQGYITSLALCTIITGISDFAEDEKEMLRAACKENDQVYGAYKVVDKIHAVIGKPKKKKAVVDDDPPF